jgi:hypothetical protein
LKSLRTTFVQIHRAYVSIFNLYLQSILNIKKSNSCHLLSSVDNKARHKTNDNEHDQRDTVCNRCLLDSSGNLGIGARAVVWAIGRAWRTNTRRRVAPETRRAFVTCLTTAAKRTQRIAGTSQALVEHWIAEQSGRKAFRIRHCAIETCLIETTMRLRDLAHCAVAAHTDKLIVAARFSNGVVALETIAPKFALGTVIASVACIALEFLAHAPRHTLHVGVVRATLTAMRTVRNGTITLQTVTLSIYNNHHHHQQQEE